MMTCYDCEITTDKADKCPSCGREMVCITQEDTKQTLSDNPGYPSTTQAQKIDSRPLDVKGKSKKTGKRAKNPKNAGELPSLTLKQSAFIQYYTDPKSDTYNNATRSRLKAYGDKTYMAAAVDASKALKSPKIHNWIDKILKEQGVDTKARVAEYAAILKNDAGTRKVKRSVVTKSGDVVQVTDEYEPTFAERLQAGHHLDKLSGDLDKARHMADAQAHELSDIMRSTFTQDKAKLDRIDRAKDVTPQAPQGETGGGD